MANDPKKIKRRDKKNIPFGVAHVNSTFNNTMITISDAKGNTIIYWTARGSTTGANWVEFTNYQLNRWGCKYHELKVGKPHYDLWIDDKSKEIEKL